MGSWKLEVAKMFLYVMFPVAAFHIFNQPEIFKEWVTKTREEIYPAISEENLEKFRQLKLEYQKRLHENKKKEDVGV